MFPSSSASPMKSLMENTVTHDQRYRIYRNSKSQYYVVHKKFGLWWRVGKTTVYNAEEIITFKWLRGTYFNKWEWQTIEEARQIIQEHKSICLVESI